MTSLTSLCFRTLLRYAFILICLVNISQQDDAQANNQEIMKSLKAMEKLFEDKLTAMHGKIGAMAHIMDDVRKDQGIIKDKVTTIESEIHDLNEKNEAVKGKVENIESDMQDLKQKSTQNIQSTEYGKLLQNQTLSELKDLKINMFEIFQAVKDNLHVCDGIKPLNNSVMMINKTVEGCEPEVVPPEETIGLFTISARTLGECKNHKPVLGFKRCKGYCESGSAFKIINRQGKHMSRCFSCQPSKLNKISVNMKCEVGYNFDRIYENVEECKCQPCEEEDHMLDA